MHTLTYFSTPNPQHNTIQLDKITHPLTHLINRLKLTSPKLHQRYPQDSTKTAVDFLEVCMKAFNYLLKKVTRLVETST